MSDKKCKKSFVSLDRTKRSKQDINKGDKPKEVSDWNVGRSTVQTKLVLFVYKNTKIVFSAPYVKLSHTLPIVDVLIILHPLSWT